MRLSLSGRAVVGAVLAISITSPLAATGAAQEIRLWELTDFAFYPQDTGPLTSEVSVDLTVTAMDEDGIDHVAVRFTSPSGSEAHDVILDFEGEVQGTRDGPLTVLPGDEAGPWLAEVEMVDSLGNTSVVPAGDLAYMGFPFELNVGETVVDSLPPELHGFVLAPSGVNLGAGPVDVVATVTAADDVALDRAEVVLTAPLGNATKKIDISFGGGTAGTQSGSTAFSPGDESGRWSAQVELFDAAGHSVVPDLASLGLPTGLDVTAPRTRADAFGLWSERGPSLVGEVSRGNLEIRTDSRGVAAVTGRAKVVAADGTSAHVWVQVHRLPWSKYSYGLVTVRTGRSVTRVHVWRAKLIYDAATNTVTGTGLQFSETNGRGRHGAARWSVTDAT